MALKKTLDSNSGPVHPIVMTCSRFDPNVSYQNETSERVEGLFIDRVKRVDQSRKRDLEKLFLQTFENLCSSKKDSGKKHKKAVTVSINDEDTGPSWANILFKALTFGAVSEKFKSRVKLDIKIENTTCSITGNYEVRNRSFFSPLGCVSLKDSNEVWDLKKIEIEKLSRKCINFSMRH